MKNFIIAAAITISGFIAGSAGAMPLVPAPEARTITSGDVVKIDYPCGRGWHLNRRGRCVPHDRWDRPPPRWHRPPHAWHRPPHALHRPPPHWERPRHSHRPPPGYWRY